ncbi:MAG: coproporphyrinogen III oxidase [Bacteroidetes bacterium]|nr:MAG: coproporphyrinogen III oxidase [Bacteroidota bacterium]
MQSLLYGVTSYLRGFQLIAKYHLWLYFWIPVLLSLVLGVAVLRTAWAVSDDMGGWLLQWYPWEWGRATIEKISTVLSGVSLVAFTLLIFRYIIMALASPFMSLLSERLEQKLYPDRPPTPWRFSKMWYDLVRGIRIALRNVLREVFFTLLLLLLGLIIPPLSVVVPILIILLQAYYAGFGNFDYTLERRFAVRDSVRFVKAHRLYAVGNGLVFVFLLMTVIGFLFALPLGTAAGTVVVLEKLEGRSLE